MEDALVTLLVRHGFDYAPEVITSAIATFRQRATEKGRYTEEVLVKILRSLCRAEEARRAPEPAVPLSILAFPPSRPVRVSYAYGVASSIAEHDSLIAFRASLPERIARLEAKARSTPPPPTTIRLEYFSKGE